MTLFPPLAVEVLRMVIFEVQMGIEQQLKELEKRRKRGMRLLAEGLWPAEVARRVGVTRQSVLRWTKLTQRGHAGVEATRAVWATAEARRRAARGVDQDAQRRGLGGRLRK